MFHWTYHVHLWIDYSLVTSRSFNKEELKWHMEQESSDVCPFLFSFTKYSLFWLLSFFVSSAFIFYFGGEKDDRRGRFKVGRVVGESRFKVGSWPYQIHFSDKLKGKNFRRKTLWVLTAVIFTGKLEKAWDYKRFFRFRKKMTLLQQIYMWVLCQLQ